jgi:O-6-methylguanine DNA methyltransferase
MARHAATVCFSSPLGLVEVESADAGITRVRLGARGKQREVGDGAALECARAAKAEILAYLDGGLEKFSVTVVPELGKPRAARAVGTACRANPVPILVPCHRIVGGNGALTGFAAGVGMKRELLELERRRTAS